MSLATNHPLPHLILSSSPRTKLSTPPSTLHQPPHCVLIPLLHPPAGCRVPTAMAAVSAATLSTAAVTCSGGLSSLMSRRRSTTGAAYVEGLNSFGGLKADNKVTTLGLPACTARSFATVVSSLRAPAKGPKGRRGGGALSSTCNAAGEIFRIAAIMNGLVLIGVAVGFVLLRVEASLEEAE